MADDQATVEKLTKSRQLLVVGKSIERVDSIDKVIGKPIYTMDIVPENALYLKVVRSRFAHALLKRVDVSEARKYPGVAAVVTARDIPGINESTALLPDKPLLATDRVRFAGEPIAAIASYDPSIAEEAVDLVKVDYEPLPAVFSPIDALKPGAPTIHQNGNIAKHMKLRKGNVEEGFKQADLIVEGTYKSQFQEPVPLEPEAGFVIPGPDGSVTCVGSMQSPFHVQTGIAKILSVRPDQVRVIQAVTGGAFGPKSDEIPVDVLGMAALVAIKTRKPAALAYTREESMIGHTKRHPFVTTLKAGVKNGKFTAWEATLLADTGAYASLGPLVVIRACFHATGPYVIPHVKTDAYCVYTNNTLAGSFRGFGGPQAHFAAESHVDEIAKKLGMDPLDFRLANILRPGTLTATSQLVDEACGLEECISKAAKESDWYRKREQFSKMSGTKRRGLGIAIMYHGNSLGPEGTDYAAVHMQIDKSGLVSFRTGLTEYGTGAPSGLIQIAAETMHLPVNYFKLEPPDTDFCADTGPTVASRTITIGGRATQMVAGKLYQKLKEVAAEMLGCAASEVESADAKYYPKSSAQSSVSYHEVIEYAYKQRIQLKEAGTFTAPKCEYDPETSQGTTYLQYTYGAVTAEVDVDTETGVIQVIKMVTAYDVGKAINPLSLEGQIEGGTVQGLGYGVMEELIHKDGIVLNPNLGDYYIPTSLDIPEMKTIIVEYPGHLGPYGAKAIGEPPIVLPAPAIVNAIDNAIGLRLDEIPATPDRVLIGFKRAREGQKQI